MREVSGPRNTQIEYIIDGLNRRVGKKVNGALAEGFLYQGRLRPVAWLNGAGQIYARFVYGTRLNVPEYMVTATGTFRFVTDHLGSPRGLVDTSTGAVIQRIEYDEWGNILADTNPGFQPFGFAGGLYDRDTGLIRFGARDYDPRSGRWTAKDPVLFRGGANVYEYVSSNPVNLVDPTGLKEIPPGRDKLIGDFAEWLIEHGMGDPTGGACAADACKKHISLDYVQAAGSCLSIFDKLNLPFGPVTGPTDAYVSACAKECQRLTNLPDFKKKCECK